MSETKRHPEPFSRNVGTCPACREYLWADVWVTVTVGDPDFTLGSTQPTVYASAKCVSMRLNHECNGRREE